MVLTRDLVKYMHPDALAEFVAAAEAACGVCGAPADRSTDGRCRYCRTERRTPDQVQFK